MEVVSIFDDAFCEMTERLVRLKLERLKDAPQREGDVSSAMGYRETIQTYGYMDSMIVCHFSDDLFQYIVDTMNCGSTPSDEEVPLYLNEYINIVCGYAISRLNDLTGKKSRLSVPSFYRQGDPLGGSVPDGKKEHLAYQSSLGIMQIYLFYSLRDHEEEK